MKTLRSPTAILVFLLPGLLVYLLAVFYPILQSLYLSLFRWDGIFGMEFVGLDNYRRMLFEDDSFLRAVLNTAVFLAVNLAIQLGLGLFLASLLTYIGRGRETIKTLFFLPTVVTTVAIAMLFRRIYSFEPAGLLNIVLSSVGLDALATPWLSNVSTALAAVSVPEAWRFMGLYMIILYAALIAVPRELQEAARIDGATEWQIFWRVRFPAIRPVWITTLVMAVTYSLRGFDIPYLLTNGGPGQTTELVTTYMYKTAFANTEFGYASALAVFIVVEAVLAVVLITRGLGAGRED